MDDIQKLLVKMIDEQPSCVNDRKQLKAVLSDYLPQNKLQQNLILNAYDEDIVNRLKPSSDVTLHALQMVKILSDDYGLANDAAMWSVISWCQMLHLGEVAEIIENTFSANPNIPSSSNSPQPNFSSKLKLGCGMYLAGVDFAAGDIKLEPTKKDNDTTIYYALIKKRTNSVIGCGLFKTQTYLTVNDGQRLRVSEDVFLSNV